MISAITRTALLLGAAGATFALAPLALAQATTLAEEMAQAGPAHTGTAGDSDASVQERARLNQEQANAARAQLDENAASKRAHDDAVTERENLIRQQEASAAQAAADHQAAMARWEETVKACKRGDRKRCEAGQ